MLSARRPELRVVLCLLLAGAQFAPAAPALAVVIQAQSARSAVTPGVNGLPLWSAPRLQAAPRLGSGLAPGLSGSVPVLPAPAVRADTRLVIAAAAPQAAVAAVLAAPAVGGIGEGSPVSAVQDLVRTGSSISGEQERGGEKTATALDSLYGEGERRVDAPAAPAALLEAPASLGLPRLSLAAQARRPVTIHSPRIVETTDESGRRIIEVGVSDLLRENDAQTRSALSRGIVREAFTALGEADPDGTRAAALSDFLRDIVDYRPEGAASVSLEMDGRNHYRLIFERGDGSRKVLLGEFLPGTAQDGRPVAAAFILMGPAEVSAGGGVSQDHRGYWREYAGGGRRLEWRAATRSERKGWGPWAFEAGFHDAVLTEQSWRDGSWQDTAGRVVKTVETVEKRSWLGRASDRIFKAPVVGPLIAFCDKAAETVLTGLAAMPHLIGHAINGPGIGTGLETGGDFAKNPLLRALKGDLWAVERLDPRSRETLTDRVRKVRSEALEGLLFPVSPEAALHFVGSDIGPEEAAAVLRGHWGVGTFGRRLIRLGAGAQGWKRLGLVAAGVAVGAFEGAAESVCNPILWAMLGLEAAVAAAELAAAVAGPASASAWSPAALAGEGAGLLGLGLLLNEAMAVLRGAAISARTAGVMAGLWTLRAAHVTTTALWWGPWLFSATDNVGRMVQLTAEGDFDKDYFKQMSKLGTDAIYYFVIP